MAISFYVYKYRGIIILDQKGLIIFRLSFPSIPTHLSRKPPINRPAIFMSSQLKQKAVGGREEGGLVAEAAVTSKGSEKQMLLTILV